MNFWQKIEENLWDEGFDVLNENDSIHWRSEKGSHSIKYKDVAFDGDKLAWYQNEEYGKSWVKIKYSNGVILNWKPISNHSDYGFNFRFIKWFGNKLIVIYTEKHRDLIVKIENLTVTVLYMGNISEIQITDEMIYVKSFNDVVQMVNLKTENAFVSSMNIDEFKNSPLKTELKPYVLFFINLDEEYNKKH